MKLKTANIYVVESGGIRPILLELMTDEGVTGLGEAGLAYGLGGLAAAGMLREMIERHLGNGRDPFRVESLWAEIYDHSFWTKGGGPVVFSAMSAIEQALMDIKARTLGVPVYELLGGRIRDGLRAYANGWYFGCTSDGDLPRAAEAAVADGYKALKFYPFATIMPDGRLRHPAPYIEEPADPGDIGSLVKVASAVSQRVAVGERVYTRYGFRDILETRAVDILQPDISNTGGLLEACKIAAMAEAYSLKVQPHICASALSTAVGMHFSASIPNFYIQEHFPYWDRIPGHREILEDPIEPTVKNGVIPIRDSPGFGVMLRKEALQDSLYAATEF